MRNESLKRSGWFFFVCLSCSLSTAGGGCQQSTVTPLDVVVPIKDRGGLAALVKSANSSRYSVVTGDFDFKVLSEEIARVYNSSSRSSDFSVLTTTVLSYCLNALIVGGFVFLVSLIFLVAVFVTWGVWRYCCGKNDDEDEDNRNLTLKAQINAWTLAACLLVVVSILIAFLVLLLIGNTWMSEGTSEGTRVLNNTLPLLVKMKSDALSRVKDVLVSQYEAQVSSLIIRNSFVPVNVRKKLSGLYELRTMALVNDVQHELAGVLNLSQSARQLSALHDGLLQLNLLPSLTNLTSAMLALVEHCNASLRSGQSYPQCANLTNNTSLLVPMASQLVQSNFSLLGGVNQSSGSRLLSLLVAALRTTTYINVSNGLSECLDEVAKTLTAHVNATSSNYFDAIRHNLTQFVHMVERDYANLTFGWPSSQRQLQVYLGSRYLDNWQTFVSSSVIVFSAAVFGYIVCLIIAMGRGLVNILLIYRYGDDTPYIEAAHQSGIFMRKLSCVFSFIPLIAAIISTAALCTAGIAGNFCGPYANFTGLLDNVFDNPATWNNTYPLGTIFVNDPHNPLTVKTLLEECNSNRSLYLALKQYLRYSIGSSIDIPDEAANAYVNSMKSVLLGNNCTLLVPDVQSQLRLASGLSDYQVLWNDYLQLNGSELWSDQHFGGVDALEAFLTLFEPNHPLRNFVTAAQTALATFRNSSGLYQSQVPKLHLYAGMAQSQQVAFTGDVASNLSSVSADLMSEVIIFTASISNTELTKVAVQANLMLNSYEATAQSQLQCDLGTCSSLATYFANFSSAVCGDFVPGLDLFWTSLFAIFACTMMAVLLTVLLAGHFIDVQLEKSPRNKINRFDLNHTAIKQLSSTLWLLISSAMSGWFVVVVFEGRDLFSDQCGQNCCYVCVEAFGVVFLGLSILTGGGSHLYQGIILYRLHKLESSNVGVKARRFWLERKKAVHFYGQLGQFFLQDIPFLILAGYFTQQTGVLNVAAFFTLAVSLLGVLAYFVYLIVERNSMQAYFVCLKGEVSDCWAKLKVGGTARSLPQEPGPASSSFPQRPHRSPYGSSESEQSDDSQGTYQEDHGFEYVRAARNQQQRLSDIQEEQHEGTSVLDQVMSDEHGAGPPQVHGNQREERTSAEFGQRNPFNTVTLDRAVNPENGDLLRRKQEAIMMQDMGGIDIADPYYRQTDAESSTTRSGSYYGSSNSITASEVPGYCSSSHAPDEIEMSDQREDYDYDSEYSHHRYVHRIRGLTPEMSVDV